MSQRSVVKDPHETLDYRVDLADWLSRGDTIAAAEWTVVDAGITVTFPGFDATSAYAWFSGGTVGQTHRVTARVTTATGRVVDCTFFVDIKNR